MRVSCTNECNSSQYLYLGDMMKNRLDRIKLMLDTLEKNDNCIVKQELCASLDISSVTLKRYLDFLEGCGYRFDCSRETVSVLEKGEFKTGTVYSKGSYISFKVLMYIYNNNPCSRGSVKRHFCQASRLDGELRGKMTLRNLDIHINRLMALGYMEKYWKGKELYYRTTESVITADLIPFKKLLELFSYLNIYGGAMPFQARVAEILEKLESALINYIRRSSEAFEDVKLAYEIFPECIKPRADAETDQFAKELEEYCSRDITLKLITDKGIILRVYPLCVVYNSYSGYWYLVCRHKISDERYQLIRLDNISKVKPDGENRSMDKKELEAERRKARQEVEESFAICIEEPLHVKLFFKDNTDIIEEVKICMEKFKGTIRKLDDFSYCYEGEIRGAMDFLAWFRRLGSNGIILEPEELGELHMASATRALDAYLAE